MKLRAFDLMIAIDDCLQSYRQTNSFELVNAKYREVFKDYLHARCRRNALGIEAENIEQIIEWYNACDDDRDAQVLGGYRDRYQQVLVLIDEANAEFRAIEEAMKDVEVELDEETSNAFIQVNDWSYRGAKNRTFYFKNLQVTA